MICDFLTVTMSPESEYEIRHELNKVLSAVGAVAVTDDLFRIGTHGTFRRTDRKGYVILSASGEALGHLRDDTLYDDYLSVLGSVPHKVSKMDIAHDVSQCAPRTLVQLYDRAKKKGVHLTRKLIQASRIRKTFGPTPWGDDSGTVYLGARTSEVHCKVYDKRLQLFDEHGLDIGAELVRFEVSISGSAGATLHAAHSPDSLFWYYMRDVLPVPANAPVYVPGESVGFKIARTAPLPPGQLLMRKVSSSPEVGLLLDLAADCGPNGLSLLLSQIEKRASRSAVGTLGATGS